MGDKPKTSHFCVFGCEAYMFFPDKIHINKLMPHSELIIFVKYENNGYYFIYHIQENVILCFTHAIFNEKFFSKYTDSCLKKCKLYDQLLNKISLETKLSLPGLSGKDGFALVPIPPTLILSVQNNPSSYSLFLSYKSLYSLVPK